MSPRQVVENYWKIEQTRDLDAILGCYEPDAELLVPDLGLLSGHSSIREFYRRSIERFPSLEVEIVDALESGDRGAFEWRSVFKDHAGAAFRLKGVNVIEVSGDRLRAVHVYFDPAELAAQADRDRQ